MKPRERRETVKLDPTTEEWFDAAEAISAQIGEPWRPFQWDWVAQRIRDRLLERVHWRMMREARDAPASCPRADTREPLDVRPQDARTRLSRGN